MLLFDSAGLQLGLDALSVLEVIAAPSWTEVPLAPACIRGILNRRGDLVTVIDLGERLGAGLTSNDEAVLIVIDQDAGAVGILVDRVLDVVEIDVEMLHAPPNTLDARTLGFVRSMVKLDQGLLLVLDPEAAVELGGEATLAAESQGDGDSAGSPDSRRAAGRSTN